MYAWGLPVLNIMHDVLLFRTMHVLYKSSLSNLDGLGAQKVCKMSDALGSSTRRKLSCALFWLPQSGPLNLEYGAIPSYEHVGNLPCIPDGISETRLRDS